MNLTPLALAAAYAALRGGNKEETPAVAPAAVPAPAPTTQIPAKTDMTQMFGATQDAQDMEAGPAAGQTPSVMTKKNPSFKQAFSEARLAGDKTFQWNGKPYTTELAGKATPAQTTTNDPGVVQRFIASQSAPNQSDAETKRLQAQNTKAADYVNKSDFGTDLDYNLYEHNLPKDKNNKVDIDQFINNIKKQDKVEGIPRTPDQYDAIKKRALEKYPNDYIQSSQPKKTSSSRVPTSEEAAANRKAIVDKISSAGQSVSDYVSNFETPAERSNRERKEKTTKSNAKGGKIKAYAKGGTVSASKRGDGIAQRGHTKGRLV
jgi:hypothetical protein